MSDRAPLSPARLEQLAQDTLVELVTEGDMMRCGAHDRDPLDIIRAALLRASGCCGRPACDVACDPIGNCTACGVPVSRHPNVTSEQGPHDA